MPFFEDENKVVNTNLFYVFTFIMKRVTIIFVENILKGGDKNGK